MTPDQNGQTPYSIEVPEYGISVTDDDAGNTFIGLHITQSGSSHDFFLCMAPDTDTVARKWSQQIMNAGREARKRHGKANLITEVRGVNSDALRTEKGR
jgi:hypothetical protein